MWFLRHWLWGREKWEKRLEDKWNAVLLTWIITTYVFCAHSSYLISIRHICPKYACFCAHLFFATFITSFRNIYGFPGQDALGPIASLERCSMSIFIWKWGPRSFLFHPLWQPLIILPKNKQDVLIGAGLFIFLTKRERDIQEKAANSLLFLQSSSWKSGRTAVHIFFRSSLPWFMHERSHPVFHIM